MSEYSGSKDAAVEVGDDLKVPDNQGTAYRAITARWLYLTAAQLGSR